MLCTSRDCPIFYRRKKELEGRIKSMGMIDVGEPLRINRKRKTRQNLFGVIMNPVNSYVLRGDKLELFQYSGYPL